MKNLHLVYFSPAFSTQKIARMIGGDMGRSFTEHDITLGVKEPLLFTANDFVVFAMPVYAGRIPEYAAKCFDNIKGDATKAAVVCVYGNRDYDDALLEMQDITESKGFKVVGGAAFIARHSIFPTVAENRPDVQDMKVLNEFADRCIAACVNGIGDEKVVIKGNRPYKVPGKIPFTPKSNHRCDKCGVCVRMCLAGAIPKDNPKKTDGDLCFLCMRCINVCPKNARHLGGIVYRIANSKFRSKCAERKEPELFF